MRTQSVVLLMWLVAGCRTLSIDHPTPSLSKVQKYMETGELYRARKMMASYLLQHPEDSGAPKIMAEIIDLEIARHKDLLEEKVVEEFSVDEKDIEARNWLERAQMLFELKQYDEAALAAEKVFLYDPENLKASELIDRIKNRALLEGRREIVLRQQIAHSEIQDRVLEYLKQTEAWIRSGRWGAAKLAVEKILLLDPENKEGLGLHDQIRAHQKGINQLSAAPSERRERREQNE